MTENDLDGPPSAEGDCAEGTYRPGAAYAFDPEGAFHASIMCPLCEGSSDRESELCRSSGAGPRGGWLYPAK